MRSGTGIPREHDWRVDGDGNERCEVPSLYKVGQRVASIMLATMPGSHYQHEVWVRYS